MLQRKNFTGIASVSKQSELLDAYGIVLNDGNVNKAAQLYLQVVEALNPRYGVGFDTKSPTNVLVTSVTTGTEGSNQVHLSREINSILVAASLNVIEDPTVDKKTLVSQLFTTLNSRKLGDHSKAALELAVPDRKSRALGQYLPRLAGNLNTGPLFQEVRDAIDKLADSNKYEDQSNVKLLGQHLTRLDALLSLDNKDLHNRFHTPKFTNELLKDRTDLMIAENVKTIVAITTALDATTTALDLRARAQFFMQKPILNQLIKHYDTSHPIVLADKTYLMSGQIETILRAIIDAPMGTMTSNILRHFEPSRVKTVLGEFEASYMDNALWPIFDYEDGKTHKHKTTVTKDDDGKPLSYDTDFMEFFNGAMTMIASWYESYILNDEAKRLTAAGWEILGFAPLSASGSWIDMFEQSPLLYTPTSWSISVENPLEAGFMPRLAAYTTDNQHGLTREDGAQYLLKGLALSSTGFRGSVIDKFDLTEDMNITLAHGSDVPLVSRIRMSYELSYFRPYSEWAGHGGPTYTERNITIAALARVLGKSRDEIIEDIRASKDSNETSMSHLFDIPDTGEPVLKDNVNPAWITWEQQQVPKFIKQVSIPYFGPRNAKIRVARNTWQPISQLAQFSVDGETEVLPFETLQLVGGGNTVTREVVN
jgi:hypothetical protein